MGICLPKASQGIVGFRKTQAILFLTKLATAYDIVLFWGKSGIWCEPCLWVYFLDVAAYLGYELEEGINSAHYFT